MRESTWGTLVRRGRFRRAHLRTALAVLSVSCMLSGGAIAVETQRAEAVSTAEIRYSAAADDFALARLKSTGAIAVARSTVQSAQLTLDSSAGRVLTDGSRTDLASGIRRAAGLVDAAAAELEKSRRVGGDRAVDGGWFAPAAELTAATALLASFPFPAAQKLEGVARELAAPMRQVREAVAAWQTEQDRLAAEAAAAQEAAAAAAEAATAQAAAEAAAVEASTVRDTAASGRPGASRRVWTSGWEPEIDACNGAVDISAVYGIAVVGEHWSCGGSSFPDSPGTIVTLSGQRAGTYRVEGVVAVLNGDTDDAADIPGGYDLLYQTCINDDYSRLSFTGLTRIG